MKLIIELKDETYKFYKENALILIARGNGRILAGEVYNAIKNGTPYNPSGDCISREQVLKELMTHQYSQDFCKEHGIEYSINSSMVRIIINEAQAVPQVTVFTESADEDAVTDLKAELQSVIEARPQGVLTEAEKIICKAYLEDLDKTHTCNEYKLLMSLIDNAQAVEITEEQAINKLHETGWLIRHDKEMTTQPQDKWIDKGHGRYECSVCGHFPATQNGFPWLSSFCPECGADMRGTTK